MATEAGPARMQGIHRNERENRKRKTLLTHTGLLMEGTNWQNLKKLVEPQLELQLAEFATHALGVQRFSREVIKRGMNSHEEFACFAANFHSCGFELPRNPEPYSVENRSGYA